MESSQSRGQTHVRCIGRQSFNNWTIREVLFDYFLLIWKRSISYGSTFWILQRESTCRSVEPLHPGCRLPVTRGRFSSFKGREEKSSQGYREISSRGCLCKAGSSGREKMSYLFLNQRLTPNCHGWTASTCIEWNTVLGNRKREHLTAKGTYVKFINLTHFDGTITH